MVRIDVGDLVVNYRSGTDIRISDFLCRRFGNRMCDNGIPFISRRQAGASLLVLEMFGKKKGFTLRL